MVCWMLGEMELEIAQSSPKESFLNRIYGKNTYNWMARNYSTCYYAKGPSLTMLGVMHQIVYILAPETMGKSPDRLRLLTGASNLEVVNVF